MLQSVPLLTGFLPEDKGPYALTPNTVELVPTLGALSPRPGPGPHTILRERGHALSVAGFFLFFFTLVAGPRRSLGLQLRDANVYEPQIRARLGTTSVIRRTV